MPYQFETQDKDYTHFSSGRVFYGVPGVPALPVRLVCEVFQSCKTHLDTKNPVIIYDPCCGAAYHLIALAFQFWSEIQAIFASDLDDLALGGARKNLSLVTLAGIDQRIDEIQSMRIQYGKRSHQEALESALWFKEQLGLNLKRHPIETHVFKADATAPHFLLPFPHNQLPDIIMADIPYGQKASWKSDQVDPLKSMLDGLSRDMNSTALVAIITDKSQKINHPDYQRIQRLNFGKRQAYIMKMASKA